MEIHKVGRNPVRMSKIVDSYQKKLRSADKSETLFID